MSDSSLPIKPGCVFPFCHVLAIRRTYTAFSYTENKTFRYTNNKLLLQTCCICPAPFLSDSLLGFFENQDGLKTSVLKLRSVKIKVAD